MDLNFDLTGTAFTQDGYYPGVPIDISFTLDTSQSTSSFRYNNTGLDHFEGLAAILNFAVTFNGQVQTSPASMGGFGGDTQGTIFNSGLLLPDGNYWEFDVSIGTDKATLQTSTDPLATLFTTFHDYGSYTQFAGLNVGIDQVLVTQTSVPEPAVWMFLLVPLIMFKILPRKAS